MPTIERTVRFMQHLQLRGWQNGSTRVNPLIITFCRYRDWHATTRHPHGPIAWAVPGYHRTKHGGFRIRNNMSGVKGLTEPTTRWFATLTTFAC